MSSGKSDENFKGRNAENKNIPKIDNSTVDECKSELSAVSNVPVVEDWGSTDTSTFPLPRKGAVSEISLTTTEIAIGLETGLEQNLLKNTKTETSATKTSKQRDLLKHSKTTDQVKINSNSSNKANPKTKTKNAKIKAINNSRSPPAVELSENIDADKMGEPTGTSPENTKQVSNRKKHTSSKHPQEASFNFESLAPLQVLRPDESSKLKSKTKTESKKRKNKSTKSDKPLLKSKLTKSKNNEQRIEAASKEIETLPNVIKRDAIKNKSVCDSTSLKPKLTSKHAPAPEKHIDDAKSDQKKETKSESDLKAPPTPELPTIGSVEPCGSSPLKSISEASTKLPDKPKADSKESESNSDLKPILKSETAIEPSEQCETTSAEAKPQAAPLSPESKEKNKTNKSKSSSTSIGSSEKSSIPELDDVKQMPTFTPNAEYQGKIERRRSLPAIIMKKVVNYVTAVRRNSASISDITHNEMETTTEQLSNWLPDRMAKWRVTLRRSMSAFIDSVKVEIVTKPGAPVCFAGRAIKNADFVVFQSAYYPKKGRRLRLKCCKEVNLNGQLALVVDEVDENSISPEQVFQVFLAYTHIHGKDVTKKLIPRGRPEQCVVFQSKLLGNYLCVTTFCDRPIVGVKSQYVTERCCFEVEPRESLPSTLDEPPAVQLGGSQQPTTSKCERTKIPHSKSVQFLDIKSRSKSAKLPSLRKNKSSNFPPKHVTIAKSEKSAKRSADATSKTTSRTGSKRRFSTKLFTRSSRKSVSNGTIQRKSSTRNSKKSGSGKKKNKRLKAGGKQRSHLAKRRLSHHSRSDLSSSSSHRNKKMQPIPVARQVHMKQFNKPLVWYLDDNVVPGQQLVTLRKPLPEAPWNSKNSFEIKPVNPTNSKRGKSSRK